MTVKYILPRAGIVIAVILLVLIAGCSTHISSRNGKLSVSNDSVFTGGCLPEHTNCSFSCVDLQSDDFNCGSCGTICGGVGISCQNGTCGCQPGYSKCSGECVDLKTDNFNCGSCTHRCAAGKGCSGGFCENR